MSERPRVVSLLPAATEMVAAVGGAQDLVGRSHECDFPADLGHLPVTTSSRVGAPSALGGSGAVDREVRQLVEQAASLYEVRVDVLEELRPDVVVTQALCDVCAVSLEDVNQALAAIARTDCRVVSLEPTRLEHVFDNLLEVGAALGREAAARAKVAELRARLEALGARTRDLPRRRVLTLEWLDPVMVGATWMPDLAAFAGGECLAAEAGAHAPTVSRAELHALEPEVILAKPCGYDLAQSAREHDALRELLAPFGDVPAYVADGNAYFNRPGPRLVESAEILAACLHPEALPDLAERHRDAFLRL